jgi:hypothetical protein
MDMKTEGRTMTRGQVIAIGRWAVLMVATLFIAGVFPFRSLDAQGVSGSVGAVKFTVTPTVNLSDGQVVQIHAEGDPGTAIYTLTAHLCLPNSVVGVREFSFQGPFCTNAPIGSSDIEQTATFPGASSADISFRVGEGSALWANEFGARHIISCTATSSCDLVVAASITNDVVFYQAHLCFGTSCPAEDPAAAPPPPPPPAAGGTPSSSATDQATAAKAPASTPQSTQAAPAAAAPTTPGATKGGGTSHSVGAQGDGTELASAQQAGAIVDAERQSRALRVYAAAIVGALCGARILAIFARVRRRNSTVGAA